MPERLARLVAALAFAGAAVSGGVAAAPADPAPFRMTVLGDSLAFGTGASDPANALAFRVYRALRATHPDAEVTNAAIGGTRVADVTRLEVPQLERDADLVLVVVGGNDVVRRTSAASFARDFTRLLAAVRARAPRATLVVCGVPDVARSPLFADSFAKTETLARALDRGARQAAASSGAAFVDLFAFTRTHGTDAAFFSNDDFHPSDAGYAQLAGVTLPVVLRALASRRPPRP